MVKKKDTHVIYVTSHGEYQPKIVLYTLIENADLAIDGNC